MHREITEVTFLILTLLLHIHSSASHKFITSYCISLTFSAAKIVCLEWLLHCRAVCRTSNMKSELRRLTYISSNTSSRITCYHHTLLKYKNNSGSTLCRLHHLNRFFDKTSELTHTTQNTTSD